MGKKELFHGFGVGRAIAVGALVLITGVAAATLAQDNQAEATGPCADYAKKLCEKADAASCQAINMATDLMPAKACEAGLADLEFSYDRLEEMKKQCAELGDRLCKDLGEDTQTCKMVRSKVPQLAPVQCKGMIAEYPKVLADLQKQEAANKPLSEADQKAVASGTKAAFGPADAKVTLVEFSDFQCPYCSRAAAVTKQIKEKYSKQVRFVFRQFPLSFHQHAHLAAEASLAAAAQGKFWEYHDVLFENQQALERESLEKYAAEVGLDMGKFKKALDEGTFKEAVDKDVELGNQVAVNGTPTLFINGARASNAMDFGAVSAQIDAGLKAD